MSVWVCKCDGTIQCDPNSSEISLETMREELASIIGEDNIISMEKRSQPMIQVCGAPTGRMNAYQITPAGWCILNRGFVGRQGFNVCPDGATEQEESGATVNVGRAIGALTSGNPTLIRELIGHPLRVYQTGDAITKDWRPDRVNIETDENAVIVDVWFG